MPSPARVVPGEPSGQCHAGLPQPTQPAPCVRAREVGTPLVAPERCESSEYVHARHRPDTDGVSVHGPEPCMLREPLICIENNKGRSGPEVPGTEPGKSRTRSANHTTRPNGQLMMVGCTRYLRSCFVVCHEARGLAQRHWAAKAVATPRGSSRIRHLA